MENKEILTALSNLAAGQKALMMAFSVEGKDGTGVQGELIPGEEMIVARVTVTQVEIKIRGYYISLSKQQADEIKVKLLPPK